LSFSLAFFAALSSLDDKFEAAYLGSLSCFLSFSAPFLKNDHPLLKNLAPASFISLNSLFFSSF